MFRYLSKIIGAAALFAASLALVGATAKAQSWRVADKAASAAAPSIALQAQFRVRGGGKGRRKGGGFPYGVVPGVAIPFAEGVVKGERKHRKRGSGPGKVYGKRWKGKTRFVYHRRRPFRWRGFVYTRYVYHRRRPYRYRAAAVAVAAVPPAFGPTAERGDAFTPPSSPGLSGGGAAPPPVAAPVQPAEDKTRRPREIIVLVSAAADDALREALMRDYNVSAEPGRRVDLLDGVVLKLTLNDNRPLDDVIRALSGDLRVLAVQANFVYRLLQEKKPRPASLGPSQYSLDALRVPQAHRLSEGDGATIAVIDTCVDAAHPELRGAAIQAYDSTAMPSLVCEASESHGTAMTSVIVAGSTLKGVAPKAKVLAVRAFAELTPGEGLVATTESLVAGVNWAYGQGARVFNLSFAGPQDPMLRRLFEKAAEKGALLIAAAGNEGPNAPPAYPAAYKGVVAVTAVDEAGALYAHANRGEYVTLAGPGVDVLSAKPQGGYEVASGTSFAAAHISGLAALMLERDPDALAVELIGILERTAKDLGGPGRDAEFGFGLADAEAAVLELGPSTSAMTSARSRSN